MESMVVAILATSAGGRVSTAVEAYNLIRSEPRHEGERLEVIVPELRLSAETAQLDHRQREGESLLLCLDYDALVELERGFVLRCVFGDEPAIVADGNENPEVHVVLLRSVRG